MEPVPGVSEGVDTTPTDMVFNERVMDYTVTTLRNDIVDYRRVVRLTTVSGQQLFLAFPDVPPADWLQFPDGTGEDAVTRQMAVVETELRAVRDACQV